MKSVWRRCKPLLRWFIVGAALFFLGTVLRQHWQQVMAIQMTALGWGGAAIALLLTLLAHITAGWVWGRTLQDLQQSIQPAVLIQAYLQTTIAKYLPGNIWHYYGRIQAATTSGVALEVATVSVLLEPILMLAAGLLVAILGSQPLAAQSGLGLLGLQWLVLGAILVAIHPRRLNRLIRLLAKAKQTALQGEIPQFGGDYLQRYPLIPLLGTVGFVLLRGSGFMLTLLAVSPIALAQMPIILSAFSLAWLLGMIVPGAPGGLGVFEAIALSLLSPLFSPALLLSAVALYRLISVLAEATGAGLAWLSGKLGIR